jgi:hypothetical protein
VGGIAAAMKFEYKTVVQKTKGMLSGKVDQIAMDQSLSDLGAQGWELAASFGVNEGYGQTIQVVLIFKREMAE